MTISKQQWAGIEASIKSGVRVSFNYQGSVIEVCKIQTDETHLAYIVTVDGDVLLGFRKPDDKGYQPLSAIFLRTKMVNPAARVARNIAKERGGKAFLRRKENRHLTEKTREVTETFFPTARTVVNHFRKIEGLTLVPSFPQMSEGGHVSVRDGV